MRWDRLLKVIGVLAIVGLVGILGDWLLPHPLIVANGQVFDSSWLRKCYSMITFGIACCMGVTITFPIIMIAAAFQEWLRGPKCKK
jgi:xanthosine utilization system XapX-like protein